MKKSLFLLSLMSVALVGCSNSANTGTSSTVDITEAEAAWQTDIQAAEMPASMTHQPTYSTPAYTTPTYSTPTYSSTPAKAAGHCHVVRDSANKPIYAQIQKGCYTGSTYTVEHYDTLFLISYLTGVSQEQIATLNNISTTTKLKVGSVLRVR